MLTVMERQFSQLTWRQDPGDEYHRLRCAEVTANLAADPVHQQLLRDLKAAATARDKATEVENERVLAGHAPTWLTDLDRLGEIQAWFVKHPDDALVVQQAMTRGGKAKYRYDWPDATDRNNWEEEVYQVGWWLTKQSGATSGPAPRKSLFIYRGRYGWDPDVIPIWRMLETLDWADLIETVREGATGERIGLWLRAGLTLAEGRVLPDTAATTTMLAGFGALRRSGAPGTT